MILFTLTCEQDGETFESSKEWAKFCSARCRNRARRDRERAAAAEISETTEDVGAAIGELADRTREALELADRLDTPLGEAALVMARQLDARTKEPLTSIAAAMRVFAEMLARALDGTAVPVEDELAALRAKREQNAGRRRPRTGSR